MTQYQLLRNNKESGPFTATQLIEMGLKPYDLVWTLGKSAAWRYPSEVEELKAFAPIVEEQPFDRFYRKPQIKKVVEENVVKQESISKSPVVQAPVISMPVQPAQVQKVEKPRIRIRADWKRIDTTIPAAEKEVQTNLTEAPKPVNKNQHQEVPDWQSAYASWENTKLKSTSSQKQIHAANTAAEETRSSFYGSKNQMPADILGVKPSGFLQQNKAAVGIAASFILLLAGGYTVSSFLKHKDETVKMKPQTEIKQSPVQNNPTVMQADIKQNVGDEKTAIITVPFQVNENATKELAIPVKNNPAINQQTALKNNVQETTNPAKQQTKPLQNVNLPVTKNNVVEKNNTVAVNNNTSITLNKTKPLPTQKAKTDETLIGNYIDIQPADENTGSAMNHNYEVSNISQTKLDLVMIDLQYFDATGRFQKGQTVYVKNLSPNQTITVAPPDAKQASKITCKVSLVSAPQKNLYLIGD